MMLRYLQKLLCEGKQEVLDEIKVVVWEIKMIFTSLVMYGNQPSYDEKLN